MSKIVFYDVAEQDVEYVRAHFSDVAICDKPLSLETAEMAKDAEIVSIFVTSKADKNVCEKLKKLKFIACRSTGYDNVDLASIHSRGVLVSNVPSYGENTVAEYAFTLLLALARKIPQTIDQIQSGEIDNHELGGFDLSGKTLGVIGTGRIGTHAISIGRGFGMKVIGFDPFPRLELEGQLGFAYVDFRELVKTCDVITIHAPLTKTTHHLLDASAFRAMKPNCVVVNTSRGEIIDTSALTDALRDKQIAGVALDVIEGEELLDTERELQIIRSHRSKQKLMLAAEIAAIEKLPNVIITPHNAFNTTEAVARIWNTSNDNIKSFLAGKSQNLVEPKKI
jgi:D-lactate dehydrogenase